jgi:hypothetical protein
MRQLVGTLTLICTTPGAKVAMEVTSGVRLIDCVDVINDMAVGDGDGDAVAVAGTMVIVMVGVDVSPPVTGMTGLDVGV